MATAKRAYAAGLAIKGGGKVKAELVSLSACDKRQCNNMGEGGTTA